jgi:hypothetical protein
MLKPWNNGPGEFWVTPIISPAGAKNRHSRPGMHARQRRYQLVPLIGQIRYNI